MRRPGWIWLAFGLCVALAALAMTRVGAMALELERTEALTRRQAALDENLQLALWRMDSALAPLVAEEGMRPYFAYNAFYPAERAYTQMFEAIDKGDVLVASPLLAHASPRVRLHFQFSPGGRLTSPQVPEGKLRMLAESRFLTSGQLDAAARRLAELKARVSEPAMDLACDAGTLSSQETRKIMGPFPELAADQTDTARGSIEFLMRTLNAKKVQEPPRDRSLAPTAEPVLQTPMTAAWIDDSLILGRRVRVGSTTFLQGCWLDWEAIRTELLTGVADLVPNAALEPIRSNDEAPTRRLAALPVRLTSRPTPPPQTTPWPPSPVRLALWIAWACLVLTAGAVALLLGGALSLSERRGTFVSAVTHELRTPLTTFRLYTEMLAEGIVRDPETRDSYVQTLRTESDRLGHLVENVLCFAGIERGRTIDRCDRVTLPALLERTTPALAARAERAEMVLAVDRDVPVLELRTDVSLVEQILTNLVDNACKYAAAENRRIELTCAAARSTLALSVRDHGPGLPDRALRRLFRPFSKSASDAAGSAPGVGLGLALSRRLARALGGDLRLDHNGPDGACFVLNLPIDR